MAQVLRVGIIGASSSGSGWARESHVPAIQRLSSLELTAIATNSQDTATASAKAFGVPKAYGNGHELITDPAIDIVSITTRVPDHRELVLAAIAAKKHIYCEWPLGPSTTEAKEMAEAAQRAGVHTAIGLQMRGSPAVRRAQQLLQEGAIGRLMSLSCYAATAGFGPTVPTSLIYTEDPKSFANLITIQSAHAVDLASLLAGDLSHFHALTTRQYPIITVKDSGETQTRQTYDHLLLIGESERHATIAVEVAGGRPPETPFHLQVVGENGALALRGGAARGAQSSSLTLSLNGKPQAFAAGELAEMPESALNVAGMYADLRDDINGGTRTAAGFDTAVTLTRLVESIFAGSRRGKAPGSDTSLQQWGAT